MLHVLTGHPEIQLEDSYADNPGLGSHDVAHITTKIEGSGLGACLEVTDYSP